MDNNRFAILLEDLILEDENTKLPKIIITKGSSNKKSRITVVKSKSSTPRKVARRA